jgi:hypothetical protein
MIQKQTKVQRIAELERKLWEAEASQIHVYHFAAGSVDKASTKHLMASGVVITLTALGGREIFKPVLIRDGLSDETIAALKADFVRSYELATILRPKGAKP